MENKKTKTGCKCPKNTSYIKKINSLKTQLENEKVKSKKYNNNKSTIELLEKNTSETYSLLAVARHLNMGRSQFCAMLKEDKVIFTNQKINYPYQYYMDKGYFVTFSRLINTGIIIPVIHVTQKGLTWIIKKYNKPKSKSKSKSKAPKKASKPQSKRSK